MSRKQTKAKRAAFKRDEEGLLAILNRWDPISGSPADEYDCLAHLILSELHRSASESTVEALIGREMREHFGIEVAPAEVASIAREVAQWWGARRV